MGHGMLWQQLSLQPHSMHSRNHHSLSVCMHHGIYCTRRTSWLLARRTRICSQTQSVLGLGMPLPMRCCHVLLLL